MGQEYQWYILHFILDNIDEVLWLDRGPVYFFDMQYVYYCLEVNFRLPFHQHVLTCIYQNDNKYQFTWICTSDDWRWALVYWNMHTSFKFPAEKHCKHKLSFFVYFPDESEKNGPSFNLMLKNRFFGVNYSNFQKLIWIQ